MLKHPTPKSPSVATPKEAIRTSLAAGTRFERAKLCYARRKKNRTSRSGRRRVFEIQEVPSTLNQSKRSYIAFVALVDEAVLVEVESLGFLLGSNRLVREAPPTGALRQSHTDKGADVD